MTKGRGGEETLKSEQRRMAMLGLIVSAWLLGASLLGATEALGYLAPTLALLGLLALGRYPGEHVFEHCLAAARPTRRPRRARLKRFPCAYRMLPRGGVLLAAGLAGRAPPSLAG